MRALRALWAAIRVVGQGLRYAIAGRHLTLVVIVLVVPVILLLLGLLATTVPIVLYPFL